MNELKLMTNSIKTSSDPSNLHEQNVKLNPRASQEDVNYLLWAKEHKMPELLINKIKLYINAKTVQAEQAKTSNVVRLQDGFIKTLDHKWQELKDIYSKSKLETVSGIRPEDKVKIGEIANEAYILAQIALKYSINDPEFRSKLNMNIERFKGELNQYGFTIPQIPENK